MSEKPVNLPKQPALKPAEDFYHLRRTGIGYIEQMGSRQWTDYNTHDPGITILEALCYTITDLAYRTSWDIKDILAPKAKSSDASQPFPNQSFFTARDILTVNPSTPDDFRRLLIDLDGVRNAWVFCKECVCEFNLYASCDVQNLLNLSYEKPTGVSFTTVKPFGGLYDVLLELEADPELGDLNDRKIEHTYIKPDSDGKSHPVIMELRFPALERDKRDALAVIIASPFNVLVRFGATRTFDVLTDTSLENDDERDKYLRDHWRNIFYVSFEITTPPSEEKPEGEKITIENASLRLLSDAVAKNATTVNDVAALLSDTSAAGFIQRYHKKLLKVQQAVEAAKALLHGRRNLDEDYCSIRGIDVEDVAVCADVEVAPDADIEKIQAETWFQIEQYFNPPVPFYTLQELLDKGVPAEEIFNGPELNNGFINAEELAAAGLKTILRTSDIINRLMDIKGVVAVNNLLLTKYDSEGNVVRNAADPVWNNGKPVPPDANKISAAWLLIVSEGRQPRLYHNFSRFLFYKNGLPFLPRMDEAEDTLTQLRGEAERPKIKNAPKDFPVPAGTFRNPEDYFPVQYSFPLTYGIGPEGLPAHASSQRRAQARQLKAYLMVFEQLLGNAFAQVAHTADLFSLSPDVQRSYFVREFSKEVIQGYEDITKGLDQSTLEEMTETAPEFHERRNRFLNHMTARFGEQFSEYALLLTDFQGQQIALERLIDDKISFLKAYPGISHDRGRAFNYKGNPCSSANISGLKKRVSLLLGYPNLTFVWQLSEPPAPFTVNDYQLIDPNGVIWLQGKLNVTDVNEVIVKQKAIEEIAGILFRMTQPSAYLIEPESGKFLLKLKNETNDTLGEHPRPFNTEAAALAIRDELVGWSSNERAIVVEHLLLRPKFPGDALYPVCVEGGCDSCDADPYSFRLTFVMPGWTAPYDVNLDARRFAERTIRQETPAHLLPKICWIGNDGFVDNPGDSVTSALLELLLEKGKTAEGITPEIDEARSCVNTIYRAFNSAFKTWFGDKTVAVMQPDVLQTQLQQEFNSVTFAEDADCVVVLSALLDEIKVIMVNYFLYLALNGWQFDRFEEAWCKWLEANSLIDWTEEHLQERVESILLNNRLTGFAETGSQKDRICKIATIILTNYGMKFYQQMAADVKAGKALQDIIVVEPDVELSPGLFKEGTDITITDLLLERYGVYKEASYRLWIVVILLSKLSNIYPVATLHDCDEGGDQNPVRLNNTALGNSPAQLP